MTTHSRGVYRPNLTLMYRHYERKIEEQGREIAFYKSLTLVLFALVAVLLFKH